MGSLGLAQPITVAIVGAGTIGKTHAELVEKSEDAIINAIVDPTPAGELLAGIYNTRYFSDVSHMLRSDLKPQGAIICTPNHTHIAIAKQLASHGIHLFIEKPLTTTYAEGASFLEECRQRGIRVCVGHHRRLHPHTVAAKHALDGGRIGRVIGVSGLWTSLKPDDYFRGSGIWRSGPSGGVVLINLIHEVDLLGFLIGSITRVYAERALSTRGHEAEEGVAITLRFHNGIVGTFLALDNTASPYNIEGATGESQMYPFTGQDCYRIFGQTGTLSVPDNRLWTYEVPTKGRHSKMTQTKIYGVEGDAYERQLKNFVGVIRDNEEPSCSGEAGLIAVAICEAIKTSLESGAPADVTHKVT